MGIFHNASLIYITGELYLVRSLGYFDDCLECGCPVWPGALNGDRTTNQLQCLFRPYLMSKFDTIKVKFLNYNLNTFFFCDNYINSFIAFLLDIFGKITVSFIKHWSRSKLSIRAFFPDRWRLQKAFYYGNEDHCYCYDYFPGLHCCYTCAPETPDTSIKINIDPKDKRALTLGDIKVQHLKDGKPLYISNIVANDWRKEYKRRYCLLNMSPEGI